MAQAERSEVLLHRFFEEVAASDSTAFDQFTGPASRVAWVRKQDLLGYASLDRVNREGAKMFANIGMDSLRTSALDLLPVDFWEDRFEGWLGNFIVGTIGNPAEERFRLTSIDYSDVRASWESANRTTRIQWGLRPWRTNPYLYVLAHAGHLNGQPFLTFEGRAGYHLFSAARLEGRVSLPLPAGFRLGGGISIDPAQMGGRFSDCSHAGVTLERVIRSRGTDPDTLFYLGFRSEVNRSQPRPRPENLLVVGLSGAGKNFQATTG